MPEYILPEENDTCDYCGRLLYGLPNCCEEAYQDYLESINKPQYINLEDIFGFLNERN